MAYENCGRQLRKNTCLRYVKKVGVVNVYKGARIRDNFIKLIQWVIAMCLWFIKNSK